MTTRTTIESPFFERAPISTQRALALLSHGDLELVGRMPYSSNATFLVNLCHDGLQAQAIYKPSQGERPLWDFPDGLYKREVAAFLVAHELGWELVPPTVIRDDGPLATGAVQLFVPHHFEEHYFTLHEASDRYDPAFMQICALDLIINNTDRKSGHCLLGTDDRIWAIDHGVAFHHQFKLRTVLWDFGGKPLPQQLQTDVWAFLERGISEEIAGLLNPLEQDALLTRTRALATHGTFPHNNNSQQRWPWPLV